MIKSYKKGLIVMKDMGCRYIDEAYFVLKEEPPQTEEEEIIREANRIISEFQAGRRKKHSPVALSRFLAGVLTASVIWAGIFFLL